MSGTNGTVMCKSLARHQLNIVCVFERSGSAGRVRMFGRWRHRRAASMLILDEFIVREFYLAYVLPRFLAIVPFYAFAYLYWFLGLVISE